MNDNDVVKALEYCANWESDKSCEECPANTYGFSCAMNVAYKMAKVNIVSLMKEGLKENE